MLKDIKPLDNSSVAPQPFPDRSNLSELYGKQLKNLPRAYSTNGENSKFSNSNLDTTNSKPQWKFAIIVNLLLFIPFALSYLSISKIYTLTGPHNVFDAASNQLTMTALTISTFVPWIISLKYLSKFASRYNTNLSIILMLYGFFVFPALSMLISLRPPIPVWMSLLLILILSQLYVQTMAITLLSSKAGFTRYRLLLIAILMMIVAAILIQT